MQNEKHTHYLWNILAKNYLNLIKSTEITSSLQGTKQIKKQIKHNLQGTIRQTRNKTF